MQSCFVSNPTKKSGILSRLAGGNIASKLHVSSRQHAWPLPCAIQVQLSSIHQTCNNVMDVENSMVDIHGSSSKWWMTITCIGHSSTWHGVVSYTLSFLRFPAVSQIPAIELKYQCTDIARATQSTRGDRRQNGETTKREDNMARMFILRMIQLNLRMQQEDGQLAFMSWPPDEGSI